MKIETVEDTVDDDGMKILVVKGPSIEQELSNRVAAADLDDTTTVPNWTITDQPADIARTIFTDICVTGTLDTDDILPFIASVAIEPDDNIPEPTDTVTLTFEIQDVFTAIQSICQTYDLGFRLIRNYDNSQLAFDIYTGSDRTTGQTLLPAVVFTPDFDNLKNTTELSSTAGSKNVAYVFSPVGFEVVYADGYDPTTVGFERKVLFVNADDIDDPVPATATALMQQRGKEELLKLRDFQAFDGEVSQLSAYKYGVDYYLGDLVETRNVDGVSNFMKVTEQIFISDAEGTRSYPTLSIRSFVQPDTWAGWPNVVWFDYNADTTTTWSTV